ncbi:MAG: GNAT family N-acetyltransferase [Acholeplasmataceae bacterium]
MKKYLKMPKINFDHYQLRTLELKDAKDMLLYASDPLVTKYLTWDNFYTLKEAEWSIKNVFFPRVKRGLPIGYAIIDLTKDLMIGTIDFHQYDEVRNEAEIGFVLNQSYWHKGIMTKALAKLIEVGFDYLGYDSIIIKHMVENTASAKVILRNNFIFFDYETTIHKNKEYRLKQYRLTKEQYHDIKKS